MKKKQVNIKDNISAASLIIIILALWQFVTTKGIVGPYLLPKPIDVIKAFVNDFSTISVSYTHLTLPTKLI